MSVKQVLKDVLFGHQGTTNTSRGTFGTAVGATAGAAAATLASNLQGTQGQSLGTTTYFHGAAPSSFTSGTHFGGMSTLGQETFNVLPENIQVNALPAQVVCQEKPAVIREVIHPSEKHEVNPIIYREREQTEIRQVEQPIYESFRKPIVFTEKALPAENRPTIQPQASDFDLKYREGLDKYKSSLEYAPVETETITKAPVIIETIRKQVREEIQPVIFREIYQPHVIKETRPIYEKIIEAPTLFRVSNQPLQKGEIFLSSDALPQTSNLMGQNFMGQNLMGQNLEGFSGVKQGYDANLQSTTSFVAQPNQYVQQIPLQQQSFGQFLPKTTNVEINEARPFMGSSSS